MTHMILDSSGNAINSFYDEVAARAALRAIVERDPAAAEDVLLISYGDDGDPVGEAVMVSDLPPSTMSLRQAFSPMWTSISSGIVASRYIGTPVPTVYTSEPRSTVPVAA